MAYAIRQNCAGERYATCLSACPVDCIHPVEHKGQPFMVIDQDACIDCGVCLPECPISAIVGPGEDPEAAELNQSLTEASKAYEKEHGKPQPRQPNELPRRPDNKLVR